MHKTTAAAALAALLLAGCASKPDTDKVNPPSDHCVRARPAIAIDAQGTARTVRECSLWYFGPSREQDTRFKRQSGAL